MMTQRAFNREMNSLWSNMDGPQAIAPLITTRAARATRNRNPNHGEHASQPNTQPVVQPNEIHSDVIWPGGNIIKIRHENRRGTRLQDDELIIIQQESIKRRYAIRAYTETASLQSEHQYLNVKHHHSFHSSPSNEEIVEISLAADREYKRKTKQLAQLQRIEHPNNEQQQQITTVQREINIKREQIQAAIHAHRRLGIAVFVNKGVFPTANILHSSINHLILKVKTTQGHEMIFGCIYGPSNSDKENNEYFLKLQQLLSPYEQNNTPILLTGDFNALLHPSHRYPPSSRPMQKTFFRQMATQLKYAEIAPADPHNSYTFHGNNDLKERLDYFIANSHWHSTWLDQQIYTKIHDLPINRDHCPISISIKAQTQRHIAHPLPPRYRRQYTDAHKAAMARIQAPQEEDSKTQLSTLLQQLHDFQTQNLRINDITSKEKIPPPLLPHIKLQRRLKTLHKAATNLKEPYNFTQFLLNQPPEHTYPKKTAPQVLYKTFQKIQTHHIEAAIPIMRAQNLQQACETIQQLRIQNAIDLSRKREKIKTAKIQEAIASRNYAFWNKPSAFWRKIKKSFAPQNNSPYLETVETQKLDENSNRTHTVTSNLKEDIIQEVSNFYSKIQQQGENKTQQLQEWLTLNAPPKPIQENEALTATASFTEEEIEEAMKKIPNSKGVGPDELPAEILKEFYVQNAQFRLQLRSAINDIFTRQETIPDAWRNATTILLFKGKGSKAQIDKYRPITLVQVIYKLYSTLLTKRLNDFVETTKILSETQQGFRRARGAAQKLLAMHTAIAETLHKHLPLSILSIDLERAFPSAEHWAIITTLKHYNIPEPLIMAIEDTLNNAKCTFKLPCGSTEPIPLAKGVRQGDPLSATLFNILINPVLQKMTTVKDLHNEEPYTGPHAYADDIDIIATSPLCLEQMWKEFMDYAAITNLTPNKDKTILIQNERASHLQPPKILINNSQVNKLNQNEPFKALGVHFTTTLNTKPQLDSIRAATLLQLDTLKTKRLTVDQRIETINRMIIPSITYAAMVLDLSEPLEEIATTIAQYIKSTTNLKGPYTEKWMHLQKDCGGLELAHPPSIAKAQNISAWQRVLNGPPCPAKDALKKICKEETLDSREININGQGAWATFLNNLNSCGLKIHTQIETEFNNAMTADILRQKQEIKVILKSFNIKSRNTPLSHLGAALRHAQNQDYAAIQDIHTRLNPDQLTQPVWDNLYEALQNNPIQQRDIDRRIHQRQQQNAPDPSAQLPRRQKEVWYRPTAQAEQERCFMIATDGSCDPKREQPIATWSCTTKQTEQNRSQNDTKSGVVIGRQSNSRAELTAIAMALTLTLPDIEHNHILIVTDSLSSIQKISKWRKANPSQQLKITDRDLLREIDARTEIFEALGKQIHYQWIPSHTDDPITAQRKQESLDKLRQQLPQNTLNTLLMANKFADTEADTKRRDAERTNTIPLPTRPDTQYHDLFYITSQQDQVVDDPMFRYIRQLARQKHILDLQQAQGKRATVLRHIVSGTVDKARSFSLLQKDDKYSMIQKTLRNFRLHGIATIAKLHKYPNFHQGTRKDYYKAMYPDANCPSCAQAQPQIITQENTEHLLNCQNRASRTQSAEQLWTQIYQQIENAQKDKHISPKILYPFAHATEQQQEDSHEAFNFAQPKQRQSQHIQELRNFSTRGQYGLIPQALEKALMDLTVPKHLTKELADNIALRIQTSIAEEYNRRCKDIAEQRHQKLKYKHYILGIPQQLPQPPPLPPDIQQDQQPAQPAQPTQQQNQQQNQQQPTQPIQQLDQQQPTHTQHQ